MIVPEEERAGAPLADFLNRAAITLAVIPPTVVASLPLDASLPEDMTLIVGTEALPPRSSAPGRTGTACSTPTDPPRPW